MAKRIGGIIALTVVAACTFGDGLTSYRIGTCDPSKPFEQDVCALALSAPPCQQYACAMDPASGLPRCMLKALDFDRDGDPPITCGGSDCDDLDPSNSGRRAEACDGKDNNCNGVADEGLLALLDVRQHGGPPPASTPDVALVQSDGPFAVEVADAPDGGACLFVSSDPISAAAYAGCALLGDDAQLAPRQPAATAGASVGLEAAFLRGNCEPPALSVRDSRGGAVDALCGAPASHPSVSELGTFVAYFDAPMGSDCTTADTTTLEARAVSASLGALVLSDPVAITTHGNGSAPPAFVRGDASTDGVLVAPEDGGVSVWSLEQYGGLAQVLTPTRLTTIAELSGAVSVATSALFPDVPTPAKPSLPGSSAFAIVGAIGCPPTSVMKLVVVRLSAAAPPAQPTVEVLASQDVIPPHSAPGSAPSVAYVHDGRYTELRVTWLTPDRSVMLRRFSAGEGLPLAQPLEGAVELLPGTPESLVAAPAPDGSLFRVSIYGSETRAIGCVP